MSNLLSIETAFLALPQVKDALKLNDINRAKRNVANAQKRKFEHTLAMASLVKNAVDFFDSEEGKELFRNEGIAWTKPELGLKVFGWQKSYFYKVIKVSNLDARIVQAFERMCANLGDNANRSLAGLLEFSRDVNLDELLADESFNEMSEEEQESAIDERISEASEESDASERVETIITLSFRNPTGQNVAWRLDANGTIHTRNTPSELKELLNIINGTLNQ
jgi:hypothetical protein